MRRPASWSSLYIWDRGVENCVRVLCGFLEWLVWIVSLLMGAAWLELCFVELDEVFAYREEVFSM